MGDMTLSIDTGWIYLQSQELPWDIISSKDSETQVDQNKIVVMPGIKSWDV